MNKHRIVRELEEDVNNFRMRLLRRAARLQHLEDLVEQRDEELRIKEKRIEELEGENELLRSEIDTLRHEVDLVTDNYQVALCQLDSDGAVERERQQAEESSEKDRRIEELERLVYDLRRERMRLASKPSGI